MIIYVPYDRFENKSNSVHIKDDWVKINLKIVKSDPSLWFLLKDKYLYPLRE